MAPNLIKLAAQRLASMDEIVVDNPRQQEAHSNFECLMEYARCSGNGEKRCMKLIGESQTGKSTIIKSFVKLKNTEEALAKRQIPVLHVTLEANITRKGLAQNILEAIGEYGFQTGAMAGSETILLQRVREYLKASGTLLLFLDEFHHLVNSESERVADSVGETIKRMLIKGVCAIVLSGDKRANRPFELNIQLQQRVVFSLVLDKLSSRNPSDLELFIKFLAKYLSSIGKAGIVRNSTALIRGDVPACLLEVSDGILGRSCNLLKKAVEIMTMAGRDDLTREDLSQATDFALRDIKDARNPFLQGFAPLRAAA